MLLKKLIQKVLSLLKRQSDAFGAQETLGLFLSKTLEVFMNHLVRSWHDLQTFEPTQRFEIFNTEDEWEPIEIKSLTFAEKVEHFKSGTLRLERI